MSKKITAVLALSTLSLALSQVAFASGYHFGTQSVSAHQQRIRLQPKPPIHPLSFTIRRV